MPKTKKLSPKTNSQIDKTSTTELASAPQFELEDKDGNKHALSSFKEDFVVLFFYPKDNTPGCTIESKEFSAELAAFKKLNTAVVGISGGDQKSKTKFCLAHKLKELMLSDTDFSTSKAFGVYGEKKFMGRKFMGIFRSTFVLDKKHMIIKKFDKVKPEGHAKEVIAFIKGLNS